MAAKLVRGFKAESERISSWLRGELGLSAMDRLDCLVAAEHLGVPVVALPDLAADGARTSSITCLLASSARFSALTICAGHRRLIVYNPTHPSGRQANSLAHELAHIVLEHPPAPALGEGGCRYWNAQYEAEADWQAGAFLVPRGGAFTWLRQNDDWQDGANHFGVSQQLFEWRVNQTGVPRQLAALAQLGR